MSVDDDDSDAGKTFDQDAESDVVDHDSEMRMLDNDVDANRDHIDSSGHGDDDDDDDESTRLLIVAMSAN